MDVAERLFAELCLELAGQPGVSVGPIMHSEGLSVHGKFFAFLRKENLVVKLPAARVQEVVAAGLGRQFETRPGRLMREWALIDLPATAPEARSTWMELARAALNHVASLKLKR